MSTPAVLQAPFVQPVQPAVLQAPFVQPAQQSSIKEMAVTGLAIGGRISSVIGAIIGVIVMLIMVAVGRMKLRDKHTASAPMTVVSVTSCTQQQLMQPGDNDKITYMCLVKVAFTAADGTAYTPPHLVGVTAATPVSVGDTITLRYDPNNPTSVTQETPPRSTGWMFIGGGIAIGALSVGMAVMSFKSKGFAAVEGAAGVLGALRI